MAQSVFRKVSLERLSSPEQLDRLITITTPKAWYALIAIISLITTAVLWGIFGRISIKLTGQGIMIQGGGIQKIVHSQSGVITDVAVSAGQSIRKGDVIARLDGYDMSVLINEKEKELVKLKEASVDKMYNPQAFSIELTELYDIAYNIKNAESSLDIQLAGYQQSKGDLNYQLKRAQLGLEKANTDYEQAKVNKEQVDIQYEQAEAALKKHELQIEQINNEQEKLEQALERSQELYDAQIISKIELEDVKEKLQAVKIQMKTLEIDKGNAKSQVMSAKSNILAAGMNEKTAKTAIEAAQTELANAEIAQEGMIDKGDKKRVEVSQLDQAKTSLASQKEKFEAVKQAKIAELEAQIEKQRTQLVFYSTVVSPIDGRVLEVSVKKGDMVQPNMPIVSATNMNEYAKDIQTVLYVPIEQGKKIIPGMEVQVTPSVVNKEEYGFIIGRVVSVSEYPSSASAMMQTLGNNELVQKLTGSGAPLEVKVDLVYDEATYSGFKWSTKNGPPIKIDGGTMCMGSIAVEKKRPISLVIPFIKKIIPVG